MGRPHLETLGAPWLAPTFAADGQGISQRV